MEQEVAAGEGKEPARTPSILDVPPSVKLVLQRLDKDQLERARQATAERLIWILNNVNAALQQSREDEEEERQLMELLSAQGQALERQRRNLVLEKTSLFLQTTAATERDLTQILKCLSDWGNMCSNLEAEGIGVNYTDLSLWIQEKQDEISRCLGSTQQSIFKLFDLCTLLTGVEAPSTEEMHTARPDAPRDGLWKWWRKVKLDAKIPVKLQDLQPLSPEKMLQDEGAEELLAILHEFASSPQHNKVQGGLLWYIIRLTGNLSTALSLRTKECHDLKSKVQRMEFGDSREKDQYAGLVTEVQALQEQKTALESQIQGAERDCRTTPIDKHQLVKAPETADQAQQMDSVFYANQETQTGKSSQLTREATTLGKANLSDGKEEGSPTLTDASTSESVPAIQVNERDGDSRTGTMDVRRRQETEESHPVTSLKATSEFTVGDPEAASEVGKGPLGISPASKAASGLIVKEGELEAAFVEDRGLEGTLSSPLKATSRSLVGESGSPVSTSIELQGDLPSPLKATSRSLVGESSSPVSTSIELQGDLPSPLKATSRFLVGESDSPVSTSIELQGDLPSLLKATSRSLVGESGSPVSTSIELQGDLPSPLKARSKSLVGKSGSTVDTGRGLQGDSRSSRKPTSRSLAGKRDSKTMDAGGGLQKISPSARNVTRGTQGEKSDPKTVLGAGTGSRGISPSAADTSRSLMRVNDSKTDLDAKRESQGILASSRKVMSRSQVGDIDSKTILPAKSKSRGLSLSSLKVPSVHLIGEKDSKTVPEPRRGSRGTSSSLKAMSGLLVGEKSDSRISLSGRSRSQDGESDPKENLDSRTESSSLKNKLGSRKGASELSKPTDIPDSTIGPPDLERGPRSTEGGIYMDNVIPVSTLEEFQLAIHTFLESKVGTPEQVLDLSSQTLETLPKDPEARRRYVITARKIEECLIKLQENIHREVEKEKSQTPEEGITAVTRALCENLLMDPTISEGQKILIAATADQLTQRKSDLAVLPSMDWTPTPRSKQPSATKMEQQSSQKDESPSRNLKQPWPRHLSRSILKSLSEVVETIVPQKTVETMEATQPLLQESRRLRSLETIVVPSEDKTFRSQADNEGLSRENRVLVEARLNDELTHPSAGREIEISPKKSSPLNLLQRGEIIVPAQVLTQLKKPEDERFTPLEMEEAKERYCVDVKSQRLNLSLLDKAERIYQLPPELHDLARNLILQILDTDLTRLGHLFRKYISLHMIQSVRTTVISRLTKAKSARDGVALREMYKVLERVDVYQQQVVLRWAAKQLDNESWRSSCLTRMIDLFRQLRGKWEVCLFCPFRVLPSVPNQTEDIPRQHQQRLTVRKPPVQAYGPPALPVIGKSMDPNYLRLLRTPDYAPMEAIWKIETIQSFYVTKKKALSSLWWQRGLFPDVPCLLDLDVSFRRNQALHTLRSRIQDSTQ